MHEKYKDQGVRFVGFTVHESERATAFLQRHGICWPNAFGVRALSGYSPTLYVVGANGRIIWTDDGLRFRHAVADMIHALDAVLERELNDPG